MNPQKGVPGAYLVVLQKSRKVMVRSVSPAVEPAIEFLRERVTRAPNTVIVLGSGLSGVAEEIADPLRIPYAEIPGFPRTTVAGHQGALLFGVWNGVEVAVMQGRFHFYEGWTLEDMAVAPRVLRALGADRILLTNAAGAIRPDLQAGDLMLIPDHLNLMFRGPVFEGPTSGDAPSGHAQAGGTQAGDTVSGDSFPGGAFPGDLPRNQAVRNGMIHGRASGAPASDGVLIPAWGEWNETGGIGGSPYDAAAGEVVREVAAEMGIPLKAGIYTGVTGPSFETPAEILMLRQLGGDAVGMSTVPEALIARALGMKTLAISCITNDAPSADRGELTHAEVLEVAARASERMTDLIRELLPRFAAL